MSEDGYTRPERSAEIMKARRAMKRYEAHREKHGTCAMCKHRSKVETVFGRSVCVIGQVRTHPDCEKDGKGLRFELDDTVLEQFRDKAA
jgi:hypothetical protein